MTQARPTHFHSFWRRKILAPTESIDDFKEVTEKEKAAVEAADAAWERPPQSFIDLFNNREALGGVMPCEGYNEDTGYFELNHIKDIDYAEAVAIVNASYPMLLGTSVSTPYKSCAAILNVRTLMPLCIINASNTPFLSNCPSIEAIRIQSAALAGFGLGHTTIGGNDWITNCKKLKVIYAQLGINGTTTITKCPELRVITARVFAGTNISVSIPDSPLLSQESISYFINKSAVTCTLTLHPDAYARVTDEMFETAAAKGITILST
ncbi:MAG: hypothetical protein ACI30W_02275 [Muribaculaceae bacterium]